MNRKELLAARRAELDAAKAIADKAKAEARDLTDEELALVESHTAKANDLQSQIEELDAKEARRKAAIRALDEAAGWELQIPPPAQAHAARAPKVVGGEASGRFSCFGEWLYKVKNAGMNAANTDSRLIQLDARDQEAYDSISRTMPMAAASGLGTAIDSDGGFLIPPEFRDLLVKQVFEVGEVLSRVTKASLVGNTLKVPYVNETSRATGSRYGGVQGYWVDEGTAPTASKPTFGRLELSLKKAACVGYITEEMMQDYSASSSLMMNAFRDELIWIVENAIINGTGAGQPMGILNANCTVSIPKESNQTAATIWGENIVKMWARLPSRSRQNAVWFVNQDVEPQLWKLGLLTQGDSSTSDVIPLYFPAGTLLNTGRFGNLMGRPVIPVEYCATLGTVGDIILADPTQYLLVDKAGGPQVASSIHVRFLQDEQAFRVTYRVDGEPMWSAPITPANGSHSLSPFLTLATRA